MRIKMIMWPPAYTIRQSKRAKRVIVQITPQKGLEVVLPFRKLNKNPQLIEASILNILNEHRDWIERNKNYLEKIEKKSNTPIELPSFIHFQAIQKSFQLSYTEKQLEDKTKTFLSLQKWVKRAAKHFLIPWLHQLSIETNLPYQKGSIRSQTTLWGSCTASKKISLNAKLLFLPTAVTRYVIIHELCHTIHLDHSKRFWKLVSQFDPKYKEHRRILRNASSYLPPWMDN